MASQLVVAVVVIAFDGGFLDSAVHSLDLTIGRKREAEAVQLW